MSVNRRNLILGIACLAGVLLALAGCGQAGPQSGPTAAAPTAQTAPAGSHSAQIGDHSLTLPDGLTISRWVSGRGGLRMMAVTNDGSLLVTEMDRGNVLAYRLDEDAPQPVVVASGLSTPSGIAVSGGYLYVAEESQISRYVYEGGGRAADRQVIVPDLPPDGQHVTRTIGIGPDNRLYVTVGSSCNVCQEQDRRRAAMSRYNLDGSRGEVIATGLRNSVGFTWKPGTSEIWATDNGRDLLGDNTPPDEVNIIRPGQDYGWPHCYGDRVPDTTFGGTAAGCGATEPPAIELQAHSAPLGLRFLDDSAWPAPWQGSLFIAFHGSWNRSVPTGYKVVRAAPGGGVSDFIIGWLDPASGQVWGRPVDIIFAGSKMYVSDDGSGSIYRVEPG